MRLLCSDNTILGHGLHSAMSRAAMAIARPTCGVVQFGLVSWSFNPGCCVEVEGKERPDLKFVQWVP